MGMFTLEPQKHVGVGGTTWAPETVWGGSLHWLESLWCWRSEDGCWTFNKIEIYSSVEGLNEMYLFCLLGASSSNTFRLVHINFSIWMNIKQACSLLSHTNNKCVFQMVMQMLVSWGKTYLILIKVTFLNPVSWIYMHHDWYTICHIFICPSLLKGWTTCLRATSPGM